MPSSSNGSTLNQEIIDAKIKNFLSVRLRSRQSQMCPTPVVRLPCLPLSLLSVYFWRHQPSRTLVPEFVHSLTFSPCLAPYAIFLCARRRNESSNWTEQKALSIAKVQMGQFTRTVPIFLPVESTPASLLGSAVPFAADLFLFLIRRLDSHCREKCSVRRERENET